MLRRSFRFLAIALGIFGLAFAIPKNCILAAPPEPPPPADLTAAESPAGATPSPAAPKETPSSAVENAVVKVFSTQRYPDLYKPWTKQAPTEATGSGAVIAGKRIITNAHVVRYASQVQVQANQAGDKISATIEAIAPGIDLAVLKLEDEKFFDSHPPLPFAKTYPDIKEAVMAYGYPTGGTSLSITKGIVSRIEYNFYNSSVSGLRIQIDAAINPGNSGGPAVVNDQMIGLTFSHLGGAQNIGYIVPCEEIELFLKDVADGRYDGKPTMFDDLQTFEDPALRTFLKLEKSVEGMLVHKPLSADSSYPLKEWDVITKIGDKAIDDQGMIRVTDHLRVRFPYWIQKVAGDGKVPLTVVRQGKEMKVELPALKKRPLVIPDLEGGYPSYFVYGPLTFTEASIEFVSGLSKNQHNPIGALTFVGNPLVTRMGDKPAFDGERLVVIPSPFFPHKLTKGYGNPALQVVKKINGHAIKNLADLVTVLRDLKDEFVTIEFDLRSGGETLVFARAEMAAATEEILNDNGVRSQGTPDMLEIWKGKPAR